MIYKLITTYKQMKRLYWFFIAVLLLSFTTNKENILSNEILAATKIIKPEFDKILKEANVKGSILVFDPSTPKIYSNNFERCNNAYLPASTFKIPNSIIALELGNIADENSVFKWNGEERKLKVWEQDLSFRDAFQYSCVPCYQELARKAGSDTMNYWLKKLNYGNMKVDNSNIDIFWLEGESKISTFEQLDFIYRFYNKQLPLKSKTYEVMEKLLFIENNQQGLLFGKTGWAIRNGNNIGWFTGYLLRKGKIFFIVSNVEPNEKFNMDMFPKIRKDISMKAIEILIK